jgi:hypothetical protein
VSADHTDFERWAHLVDRQACDEPLTAEELEFCKSFARKHALCDAEFATYHELSDFTGAPTDSSRGLVDRTLQRLEAEDAERAAADLRLLRRPRVPSWLAAAGTIAIALGAFYVVRSTRSAASRDNSSAALEAGARAGDPNTSARGAAEPTPSARAELVYTSGDVSVAGTNSGVGRTLLAEGSVVETAAGGACVLIDSDINVCLAPHSRMRLAAIATVARRIELEAGALATRLATQPEGMSLSIVAAGVASTAVGTAFAVELSSEHAVTTTVLNGKVRVVRGSESAVVRAHERALSTQQLAAPRVSSVSRQDEAPSWALLGETVLWHDPVAATLEVRGEPATAEVWLDEQWVGVTPLSTLLPVGEHRLTVRKGGRELANRELRLQAGESIAVNYQLPVPPTAAVAQSSPRPAPRHNAAALRVRAAALPSLVHAEATEPAPALVHAEFAAAAHAESPSAVVHAEYPATAHAESPSAVVHADMLAAPETSSAREPAKALSGADLLRRARQAVRAGRFSDAALSYASVVNDYSGSDEAQAALVLLGQLRLTQLHDPRGALEALNAYLRSGGSLELEARVARIEALHALKRSAEEATAIDEFLHRHPHSFEAKALRARLHAPAN